MIKRAFAAARRTARKVLPLMLTALLVLLPAAFAREAESLPPSPPPVSDAMLARFISAALAEEGLSDGTKYGAQGDWCAFFVVWCAREAGIGEEYISSTGWANADALGVVYRGRDAERTREIEYIPKPGDIIIFDWADGGFNTTGPASSCGDHVGIVEKTGDGRVWTIEGNTGDGTVKHRSWALDSPDIKGYGVIGFPESKALPPEALGTAAALLYTGRRVCVGAENILRSGEARL